MSEENIKTETVDLIEVSISDDKKQAFIKLEKLPEGNTTFTKEQLLEALQKEQIIYGIVDSAVEKLALRPIFNIRIKVAEATDPIDGNDGFIKLYVKKDADYKPEYSDDATIDYKNLDYFQMVKKGQVLCEITRETAGIDGKDIHGQVIPAHKGRKPQVPAGKNTTLTADESKLIADCDGVIKFVNTINIDEMMHIRSNIDFSTGNINFPGDVTIDGDVSSGFSVKAGGNLIIKGVVEDAVIEAAGDVVIAKGIYGGSAGDVIVGKDLRCNYIENAVLHVEGDITVDYIIDGKISCNGNIHLSGSKELVVGGEIKLRGELVARDIGNDREYPTVIRILGEKIIDQDEIDRLTLKKQATQQQLAEISEKETQINGLLLAQEKKDMLSRNRNSEAMEQIASLKKQINKQAITLKRELEEIEAAIIYVDKKAPTSYYGSVSAKRKLYRGTRIYFGEMLFGFEYDNLEHCRIYWDNDDIVNGMM